MTLIRYPGSKAKLAGPILAAFPEELLVPLFVSPDVHYVEPFFGSGAIGFEVMRRMHRKARVTIADADIGIVSLWQAVLHHHGELIRAVLDFVPCVDAFYELKNRDGEFTDVVDTGFRKLALHRISVSGFGFMAGGPIGGRHQTGNYTVDCRWKPNRTVLVVQRLHKLLSRFQNIKILNQCVFDVLAELQSDAFAYLDPPYYEKGNQLYKHGFSHQQHVELASVLSCAKFNWALSYDDHPEIRKLYLGHYFKELRLTYSNAVCREAERPKNHEVLILPKTSRNFSKPLLQSANYLA